MVKLMIPAVYLFVGVFGRAWQLFLTKGTVFKLRNIIPHAIVLKNLLTIFIDIFTFFFLFETSIIRKGIMKKKFLSQRFRFENGQK